jgi:hypothetical protein
MNPRITLKILVPAVAASLLLASPPTIPAAMSPKVTAKGDSAEAKALREAEVKLAALVKEAQRAQAADTPVAPAAERLREPSKEQPAQARKKKLVKKRSTIKVAKKVGGTEQIVQGRRLTQGEIQRILATSRDFSGANLSGVSLVGWDLSGVRLNRSNLKMADLERVNLAESDLELADLSGANLSGALLNQARVRGARLEGTKLDGAIWTDKTICRKGSVGSCVE